MLRKWYNLGGHLFGKGEPLHHGLARAHHGASAVSGRAGIALRCCRTHEGCLVSTHLGRPPSALGRTAAFSAHRKSARRRWVNPSKRVQDMPSPMDPACQPSQHGDVVAVPILSFRPASRVARNQSCRARRDRPSPPGSPADTLVSSPNYVARAEAEATRPPTTSAKCPEDSSEGGAASPAGAAKDADSAGSGVPALRCSTSSRRTSPDDSARSKTRKAGKGKGKGQQQPRSQRQSLVGDWLRRGFPWTTLLATIACSAPRHSLTFAGLHTISMVSPKHAYR